LVSTFNLMEYLIVGFYMWLDLLGWLCIRICSPNRCRAEYYRFLARNGTLSDLGLAHLVPHPANCLQ
jgi:hypothetical protein